MELKSYSILLTMLSGHLAAEPGSGKAGLVKVGRARDEEGVGDAVAADAVVVRRQRELIKVDANLTDGELEDDGVPLQREDAHRRVDATGEQAGVVRRDEVGFIAGHHGATGALV